MTSTQIKRLEHRSCPKTHLFSSQAMTPTPKGATVCTRRSLVSVFLFYPLRGHTVLTLPLYEHTVVCLLQAPENNAAVSPCPFLWPRVQDTGWRVVGAFPLSFVAAPTLVNTVTSCLCFRALPALDSDEVEHVSLPSCFLP